MNVLEDYLGMKKSNRAANSLTLPTDVQQKYKAPVSRREWRPIIITSNNSIEGTFKQAGITRDDVEALKDRFEEVQIFQEDPFIIWEFKGNYADGRKEKFTKNSLIEFPPPSLSKKILQSMWKSLISSGSQNQKGIFHV